MAVEKDISTLNRRVGTVEEKVAEMREAVVEHRTRLQGGVKTFSSHLDRIETIEKKIEPNLPSVPKIVGITFAIMMAAAGALWALANMIRDRPTVEQIDKVIDSHDTNGHRDMKDDIRSVQIEQGKQRTLFESMQVEQKTQGGKLDTLLLRTPAPPPAKLENRSRGHRSR